jgi:PKD repeat protein
MVLASERRGCVALRALFHSLLAVPLIVCVSRAQTIQTVDYSDRFTVAEQGGIPERPDGSYNTGLPAYNVEDSHGNPASAWTPFSNFSFNTGLGSTCCGYPTNDGNPGSASGLAQTGGGDFSFAYGLRTNYSVRLDGNLPNDRLDISSLPGPGASIFTANSLSVFFRRIGAGTGTIGFYNGSVETALQDSGGNPLTTGIAADDNTWHSFGVQFNQDQKRVSVFVDDVLLARVDVTDFAGGIYDNYSNAAVGAGGAGSVLWVDNFEVGQPPPGLTTACFTASTRGGPTPLAVDFDGSCSFFSGSALSYNWTFGDGISATGPVVSHTYSVGGSYQVTLTVKDTNLTMDSASKTITAFETTDSFQDNFDRADGPIDGWTVFSVADTWNIASGALTTGPTSEERFIWAGDPPFIFPERVAYEFDMTFLAPGTNGDVGRHGGAVFCSNVPTHRFDPAFSGYFIDWIDRTSDRGLRITRVDNGFLNTPTLGGGPADVPLRWRVEMTATKILVYGDGALYINLDDATYRGGFAGLWTWAGGEEVSYDNVSISVPTNPLTPCFTTGGPALPTPGTAITFDAACTENAGAGTINSYSWDFGDTTSGNTAQISHAYASPGIYSVKLVVRDTLGNQAQATRSVTVFQKALSFSDAFERPNGPVDGWTVFTPPDGWNLANGELTTGPTTRENWVWAGDTPIVFPRDATIAVDQLFTAPGTNAVVGRHAGVVFCANKPTHRYDPGFNGYFIDWIDRAEDHGPRLSRVDNGVPVLLVGGIASLPEILPDQEPPLVWSIELVGEHIRVSGDDVEFFDFTDGTYRGGLVGLWTWEGGQEVSYDNFSVNGQPLSGCFTEVPSEFPITGLPVSFDGSCSESFDSTITSYTWDFGDGMGGNGVTVQHAYSAAGPVTAKLTVRDLLGRTAEFTHEFTVVDVPLVPFADCFDRNAGPVDGWTAALGTWDISADGQAEITTTAEEGFLYAGDPPAYLPPSFVCEVDWTLLEGTNPDVGRHAAVNFFWNLPTTNRFAVGSRGYSVFYIDRVGDRGLTLGRWDTGGSLTVLNPPGGTPSVTEPPATLRIEVVGANISVFADGVKVIDVNDSKYRDGLFALWVWNSNAAQFDNVRIGASDLPSCNNEPRFVRGDSNASGKIDLTDAVVTLNYLFLGVGQPACFDAADADDNGKLQLTDAVRTLNWLFIGGPPPPAPTPSTTTYDKADCGVDPVSDPPDLLGCATFGPCL